MVRARRLFGLVLVASGAVVLAWVVVVWRWQDPITALYTVVFEVPYGTFT